MSNDRIMVTKVKIDRIGDALRERRHEDTQYTLDEMPEAIRSIPSGGTWYSGPVVPEAEGITYTVRIDLEKVANGDDPNTWGEWIDDAVDLMELPRGGGENGVDALMGYYPCALNVTTGEEIAKLQPNNYRKTLAGDDINADYVMVYFPERGMKVWYEDSTHLCISITTADNKAGYIYPLKSGHRISGYYIGAYQSVYENNTIYSKRTSESYPHSFSNDLLESSTYSLNNDYCRGLSAFAWTYLTCCAYIKYKGKTLHYAFGDGNGIKAYPGGMDTSGLNNITSEGLKIFGLERLLGCYFDTHLCGWYRGAFSNGDFMIETDISGLLNTYIGDWDSQQNVFLTYPTIMSNHSPSFGTFFQLQNSYIPASPTLDASLGGCIKNAYTNECLLGGIAGSQKDPEFSIYAFIPPGWDGEDIYGGRMMFFKPRS